jgi:hypothetical protein
MSDFVINKHGVCTNPDELILHQNRFSFVAIYTAFYKGEWAEGMDLRFRNYGHSYSPAFDKQYRCSFKTKGEALDAANTALLKFLDYVDTFKEAGAHEFCLKIRELIEQSFQLELFA